MKFLKDIDVPKDLIFKKVRSTPAGARIIDLKIDIFQTCWCKVRYDVDYAICTDVPEELEKVFAAMDNKIVEHCAEVLGFCEQEIASMYRPILRTTNSGFYFRMPISNSSVLWGGEGGDRKHYNKKEMAEVLKIGNYVRFVIRMKKLYFKDHNLTVQTELVQAEYS